MNHTYKTVTICISLTAVHQKLNEEGKNPLDLQSLQTISTETVCCSVWQSQIIN